MATKTETTFCPQCGKTSQGLLAGQACPQCLMKLAMRGGPPTTPHHTGLALDAGHVPPVEQLVSEFPDLEIQHLVGHGGMGAVYQARQIQLDRVVALKILSPRLSDDPAFAERFLREARTLAKLSHPNIVTVFDFGQAGGFYYLTMEFVDGVNLRDTISANLLEPAEALKIVPQVCEALQYAHDNGVVHRDIKPENILITKGGNIKIADFGLAKILEPTREDFTLTATRQVLGTRNYMAPEQIESPEVVDHRADLYSLGVVFYELLTGELPLGRFALPSEKSASISRGLDDVVMRTLEKDPGRRFQQASEIKTACESINSPNMGAYAASPSQPEPNENLRPICQPFPITIEDIYASLAAGYGMMRGFETHIEVEFEIRDAVMDQKWGTSKKVQIPLERIVWIKMREGLVYTHIEIQTDQFDAVADLPNGKQGLFRVYLKKRERETARQLVNFVQGAVAKARSPQMMPPVKQSVPYGESKQSSGATIVIGLAISGVVFFFLVCAIVATYLWLSMSEAPPARPVEHSTIDRPSGEISDEPKPMIGTPVDEGSDIKTVDSATEATASKAVSSTSGN